MENFGTLDSTEKTIAVLGDRLWTQAAKQEGDKLTVANSFYVIYGQNVSSAQNLEASLPAKESSTRIFTCNPGGSLRYEQSVCSAKESLE